MDAFADDPWAASVGSETKRLVETILSGRAHPEQGYRTCLGILRLGKVYGTSRLEAACGRAMVVGARSYRHVDSILKHGLDRLPRPGDEPQPPTPIDHENVRGPKYYN